MAWEVDHDKVASRRRATDLLAMAHNNVSTMRDKTGELLSQTQGELHGHPTGDRIIADVSRSFDALGRALSVLADARASARAANVMKWVPDPDE